MTEGDKKAFDGEKAKAWEKQAGALSRSQNLKKHRKTFNRGYNAGFQAGRDSKGDGWVPIADIPEEWKDGRDLDVAARYYDESGSILYHECSLDGEDWMTGDYYYLSDFEAYPTHVRLPHELPQPPQDRKEVFDE